MPDYLDLEPEDLRRIARQHDRAAANVRQWGEIPRSWLDDFERAYGTIADPMRGALEDYYDRRYYRAERQAARHESTRDELMAAARAMEDGDAGGAQSISSAGDFAGAAPSPGARTEPVATTVAGGPTGRENSREPHSSPLSGSTREPAVGGGLGRAAESAPARSMYATAPPQFGPVPPATIFPPGGTAAPEGAAPSGVPVNGTSVPGRDEPLIAEYSSGISGEVFPATTKSATESGMVFPAAADARKPLVPLAVGPFISARSSVESNSRAPSLVVGRRVDEDLVLARTLLAAVLAAVPDSAPGIEWAAAVLRAPVGPFVLLLSTEGRAWLPPGLYLPSEVTIPWKRAVGLRSVTKATAGLEGSTDPARILAAFAAPGLKRFHISALTSSLPISDELRIALGNSVALEAQVAAGAPSIDFTSPGPGLVDRLTLDGSGELLRRAEKVPDMQIQETCLELARNADARVRAAFSVVDGEVSVARDHRQKVLGQTPPAGGISSMSIGSGASAVNVANGQVDRSRSEYPPVWNRSHTAGTSSALYRVFERRVDELVWFATGEPSRQTLRDALYAYGQIVDHPLFSASAVRTKAELGVRTPPRTNAGTHPVEHDIPDADLGDARGHPPDSALSGGLLESALKGEFGGR